MFRFVGNNFFPSKILSVMANSMEDERFCDLLCYNIASMQLEIIGSIQINLNECTSMNTLF